MSREVCYTRPMDGDPDVGGTVEIGFREWSTPEGVFISYRLGGSGSYLWAQLTKDDLEALDRFREELKRPKIEVGAYVEHDPGPDGWRHGEVVWVSEKLGWAVAVTGAGVPWTFRLDSSRLHVVEKADSDQEG